jgi:transcriptional regulator with XRE-family HTH domain
MAERKVYIQLGKRIKDLRMQKNMTQNALAIHCNFEKASLSRIESGKSNITIRTIFRICQALEIDIQELLNV